MTPYDIARVRDAARELASLEEQGMKYGDAEMKVIIKYDIPDEFIPRLQECYATEFAIDDG